MSTLDYTIVFIFPSTLVCKTTKRVLDRLGFAYPVFESSTKEALEIALQAQERGCRMIVSHGLTYDYLRSKVEIAMLALPFSGIEAAVAVKEALNHSNRIIHMGTRHLNHYLNKSLELLNLDEKIVAFHPITSDIPLEEQTQSIIDAGYDVIIGGFPTVNHARKCGKTGIEFDVDEQVVEATVYNAVEVVKELVNEENKRELITAILRSTSEGIIAIDEERRIFNVNPAAEEILKNTEDAVFGKALEEVLEDANLADIRSSHNKKKQMRKPVPVVLSELPVNVSGHSIGSVISIKKAAEIQDLEYEIRQQLILKGLVAKNDFDDIAGNSQAIVQVKERAYVYAQYNSTILITGETGTGKELFAQSIHNSSPRKNQPFVAVNCATLPENLMESELFGYVKGAFTGANREGKIGLFEAANNGTIFLDEISEIPIAMQSKLLRAIQEGEIIRIGGDKVIKINTRILCSSNKSLPELVRQGKFKDDLYYRLCVLEIHIPPLRERRQDIAPLAFAMLKRFNKRHGKNVTAITEDVLEELTSMDFHGNVRELGNIIERMMILTENAQIDMHTFIKSGLRPASPLVPGLQHHQSPYGLQAEIPPNNINGYMNNTIPPAYAVNSGEGPSTPGGSAYHLKKGEIETILEALSHTRGNKAAAAKLLGIHPSTLWRKMKSYNIPL